MKFVLKAIFLLSFFLIHLDLFAQNETTGPDEGMDIFLLSILVIFFSVMLGAAVVGAFAGLVALFFVFLLIGAGALSASVAIGLYKRSYSSAFKSFLVVLFALTCGFIGGFGILAVGSLFHLNISNVILFFTGLVSGAIGGMLLTIATFKSIQLIIKHLMNRYKIAN